MKKPRWYHTLLAAVLILSSGMLLAVSFDHRWGFFGWISMMPLLIGTRFTRPGISALLGFVAIAICGCLMVGGLANATEGANAMFLFLGLALMFAAVPALCSYTAPRMSPALWVVFVACAAVASEWAIDFLTPASTSLPLAHSQAALGIARFTGIWGVTFLVWLIPGALAMSFAKKKKAWPLLIPAMVAIAIGWVSGGREPSGKRVTAAAVQCMFPEQALDETSRLPASVEYAVWPEYVIDGDFPEAHAAATQSGAFVVASITEHTGAKKPYNTAILISPDGEKIGQSRKRHLFGDEVFHYFSGMTSSPIDVDGTKVALAICYDTVFTDVTRDLASQGAQILFVPTGDPVIHGYLFHKLHAGMVAFRAAENGIPIVWADAHGMSTVFDSLGRVVEQAPTDRQTAVFATVKLRNETTPFTRMGDVFAYACAGAAFAILVIVLAKETSSRRQARGQGTRD